MKVSFIGNFEDPGFEGLVSISLKIKAYLEKKGFEIDFNDFDRDLLHIHSNGFLESKKNKKYGEKCIYSLYSNLNQSFIGTFRYYLEYLLFYYDGKNKDFRLSVVLKNAIFSVMSSLIPLYVKKKKMSQMRKVVLPNDFISKKLGLENSEIIKFGIDVNKFRKLRKDETLIKNKKLVVAYFGHNTPLKGIPDFLKVADIMKNESNPNIEFRLYVSNHSPKVDIYAVKHNVKVYGFIKDIVKEYDECDIVILPYRSDVASIGVPLVLIEAMACEKAIITTNLEYIKEVIGDCGICVEVYKPKEIVDAILKLNEDIVLRREFGMKARERVIKYYNQEKMFEEYKKLYVNFSSNSLKFH